MEYSWTFFEDENWEKRFKVENKNEWNKLGNAQ